MSDPVILELEAAAKVIMAPPNVVTPRARQDAEGVFMNFRKSKTPYKICRQILEQSSVDYVLFEAAEVIKRALIREWNFLPNSDKESLEHYLYNYVISREVPPFVRDRILQVIAIMVKRMSADDSGRQRMLILGEVQNLIMNAEHKKKILGCQIILIIMQEYATTVKSTDVGLQWEVHFKAKKQFEGTDLQRIFKFVFVLLTKIAENDSPFPSNVEELSLEMLKILEQCLTWGHISPYLPKKLIGIYESVYEADNSPALRLNGNWTQTMTSLQLIPLMFQIYWKMRYSERLAHHAVICLVQLASLNGEVFGEENVRLNYLSIFMENFSKLLSSVTIKSKESLGISNVIRKLTIFFTTDLNKINKQLQITYLEELTNLTCSFCEGAAMEETAGEEDKRYNDAFENVLEAWAGIIQEFTDNSVLREYAIRIFNTYIQCHIAPPDGLRRPNENQRDDIEDNEDSDRVKFKDQLQTIGMSGRIVPDHSLPIIFKLLEQSSEKLKAHLQLMQTRAMTLTEATALQYLFEDIHWIILIAGHILCMDSDGETPMIPSEIMDYSLDQIKRNISNTDATLQTLASIRDLSVTPANIEQTDHVIRIFTDILKLCVIENLAAENKLSTFLSPEVGCSAMWFIKRWCLSYLLPVENYYQEVSPILMAAVGQDTEGANFVINFILSKVQANICYFHTEPVLLKDTVELFADIVCVKQKSVYIIKTDGLWHLINMQSKLEPGVLPQNIRKGLYKGFVSAGTSLIDSTDIQKYYQQILTPVQVRFNTLVDQENFNQVCHQDKVQKEIIDLLECLIGIAKGGHMVNNTILFEFICPILFKLPPLLRVCSNYQVVILLILDLFGQCAKHMLCFLNPNHSRQFYEASLNTIQVYSKCNGNRFSAEKLAQEDTFEDLVAILDLLTFILSKDCLDFCPAPPYEDITVTACDVALDALKCIMPLMSLDLLKYPSLCNRYYRLLALINDIFPEKIVKLDHALLNKILTSIEIGLKQDSTETVQACLDFIQVLCTHIYMHPPTTHPSIYDTLKPFLQMLMDLTISHQINSDLMQPASVSIFALICCYMDEYRYLVQTLIHNQADPLTADRLSAAFTNLTTNIEFNCDRLSKIKFRDNFDKFITNVHGFLLVK